MKKLLLFAAVILFAGVMFAGCDKDETKPNTITMGGETGKITDVKQVKLADTSNELSAIALQMTLSLGADIENILLTFVCEEGSTTLPAGTYIPNDGSDPESFAAGQILVGEGMVTGSVKVSVKNGRYTIDFNLNSDEDGPFKGHYSGLIPVVEIDY